MLPRSFQPIQSKAATISATGTQITIIEAAGVVGSGDSTTKVTHGFEHRRGGILGGSVHARGGSAGMEHLNKTPDFRVEWVDDEVSRLVRVFGEVDLASAASLRAALDCQQPRVVVDLTHVTFMDLSGLGCLIEAVGRQKVVAILTSPRVDRLLDLTATSHLFEIG